MVFVVFMYKLAEGALAIFEDVAKADVPMVLGMALQMYKG